MWNQDPSLAGEAEDVESRQGGLSIFIACPKSVFPENGIKKIFWLF